MKKDKMIPLQKWLGKIVAKDKVKVEVRISEDVITQQVTDLLNVFAALKITEITFTGLLRYFESIIEIAWKGLIKAYRGLIELHQFDSKGGKNLKPLKK